jgi:small subunit ribosomal protein S11
MGKKKVAIPKTEEVLKEGAAVAAAASKAAASKKSRHLENARVYINASYNNTIVTVTDDKGNVISWATAGSLGFSGPKKATPFAASKVISVIAEKLKNYSVAALTVIVKGVGSGRDSAIRSLINHGFNVVAIKDVTPIPHNGPRPPKVRRV